jgi:hypothetical protein
MRCRHVVVILILSLCAAARAGESWTKLADAPEDPAGREFRPGHLGAWCHVPELKGFILYGGRTPCFQNGMWLFDPAKKEWKMLRADDTVTQEPLAAWQKAAANDPLAAGRKWRVRRPEEIKWSSDRPGAGDSHGICYDPVGKTVWFLGGFRYNAGGELGGWKYLPAQDKFEKVALQLAKDGGVARLAYDAERRLMVAVPVGPDWPKSSGTLNPATGEWKEVPAQKFGWYPAMAYDAGAKLTVLFAEDGKTWTFDGAAWKDANPAKQPPARKHPGMCHVPDVGGVILVGGVGKQDAWKYDAQANAWEEIPAPGLPLPEKGVWGGEPKGAIKSLSAYYCDALAYDPETGAVTLFDATIGVWALKLGAGRPTNGGATPVAAAPGSAAPAGDKLGARKLNPKIEALGENAWVDLGLGVPGGWEIGLAYDEANRLVFKYGGCGTGPQAPGDYGYSNMMCLLDVASGQWHIRRPTHMYGADGRPINGCGRAFCYDSTRKLIWTINGVSSGGTGGADGLFSYDGAADKFEHFGRANHSTSTALCHSPEADVLLLLQRGGTSCIFDAKARQWKKETPKGPETTGYDQIVWIPELRKFVACLRTGTGEFIDKPDYANMGPTRALHKDPKTGKYAVVKMVTWGFDPATMTWSDLKPKHEPQPPRTYDGFCYDSRNKVVILTGGGNAMWDGKPEVECNVNDTWAYDPRENDWKEMKPANPPPAFFNKAACCFDTEHGVMLAAIRGLWAYRYK